MNRLGAETSPYLRQHRDNPVDWFPWGPEAFEEARRLDRPVLLSIGYSACHWCHVMAHESFEDPATAAVMNDLFVNVKVDREERPDVDAIYMQAVQAFTGRGGWPMTVMMTAEGRPFFAGTYFPPDRFVTLMQRIDELWRTDRASLFEQGDRLVEAIERIDTVAPAEQLPGIDVVDAALDQWRNTHDHEWGGFGEAPKFPPSMAVDALLRAWHRTGADDLRSMALDTLDAMAAGGMYDHLEGGFARYSTDRQWLVPHFEKMLYDQALLLRAYTQGWLAGRREAHLQVVEETVGYILDRLAHPEGGFFSAEDADSEGEEGRFYVWTPEQVAAAVPDPGLRADISEWYGITEAGNWDGVSVLRRPLGTPLARPADIERARTMLADARTGRLRPGLDDKILTEWNALLVGSLADAGAAFGRPDWVAAAERCAGFLLAGLRSPDGRWLRSWQGGRARHLAYAVDLAALVDGFTRLGEATGTARWIDEAIAAARQLLDLFWDDEKGNLFTTGSDAETLVTRPRDIIDDATPSASSLAAVAFLRLWALTGRRDYLDRSEDILRAVGQLVERQPTAFAHLLGAIELRSLGPTEIVIVGDEPELVEAATSTYRPHAVLAWGEPYMSPLWEGRDAGRAYVCQGYACQTPATTPADLHAQLSSPYPKFGRQSPDSGPA